MQRCAVVANAVLFVIGRLDADHKSWVERGFSAADQMSIFYRFILFMGGESAFTSFFESSHNEAL